MTRDEALRILAEHKDEITAYGVRSLSVFGSVARNEARPDSDVDIMVEFDRPIGIFGFTRLQEYLEGLFSRRVDLVTRDSIKPRLRERIIAEASGASSTAPREWKVSLDDMLQSVESALSYVRGMTLEKFAASDMVLDAVALNLEILGESAARLPVEVRSRYPRIPWPKIMDLPNLVAYEFYAENLSTVWRAVTEELPQLSPLLHEILEKEP